MNSLLFVLTTTAICGVNAVSSGFVDNCNAIDPSFGCTTWGTNTAGAIDRSMCKETGKLMNWVLKPVTNTTMFELFAGTETARITTYTPGKFVQISLRSKIYNAQYRGLLLYAVDAADTKADPTKVGSFEFVDTKTLFHSFCPGTVLHASAELKPYLTTWRYLPPADFTGTLKFLALIKVGPANRGEFYYPNQLTLARAGSAPALDQQWFEGSINQSCDEVCAAVNANLQCDATKVGLVTSAALLETNVTPFVTCKPPYLARCGTQGVATDASGACYYPNAAECTAAGLATTTVAVTCASKSNDANIGRRICPCSCKPGSTCVASVTVTSKPTVAATTKPVVVGTTTPRTAAPTTRAPGVTAVPTTGAPVVATTRAPVGTTAKAPVTSPVCSGTFGCMCDANGNCEAGLKCSLMGNMGFCIKTDTCVLGELGCKCRAEDGKCSGTLACKESVCARDDIGQCTAGALGCACNDDYSCTMPNAKCARVTQDATDKGLCALVSDGCAAGTLGCPCKAGACTDAKYACKMIGATELCVDDRVNVNIDGPVTVSASSMMMSAFVVVVAAAFAL